MREQMGPARPKTKVARTHGRRNTEWVWLFQEGCRVLRRDQAITLQPLRVFLFLAESLTFGAMVRMSQSAMAQALGMPDSNVSRALKVLERAGVVLRETRGRQTFYGLNSDYVYKGVGAGRKRRKAQHRHIVNTSKTRAGSKNGC